MNFRRRPFQFSATNPADRQSELLQRFGVPSEEIMFTETNPTPFADAPSHLSPRLQHRIPGFLSNKDHADNVDSSETQPKVRIVPIQIEGDSEKPSRHRAHSGEASVPIKYPDSSADEEHTHKQINSASHPLFDSPKINSPFFSNRSSLLQCRPRDSTSEVGAPQKGGIGCDIPINYRKNPLFDPRKINSPFFSNQPSFLQRHPRECTSEVDAPQKEVKVCSIPINIKDKPNTKGTELSHSNTLPLHKETSKRGATKMGNGPCVSKSASAPSATNVKDDKRQKTDIAVSLKQIEMILNEFKSFEEGVNEFSDVQTDKRYRYLDEMLTRCMLKLDDIETFGNEEVRKARKAAVKRVQDTINVLDSKVQHKPDENKQISDKVQEPATNDDTSQLEMAVEDIIMIEADAQNLKGVLDQSIQCSENVITNKSDLNEVPDNTMEVEIPENVIGNTEQVVSSEDTLLCNEQNEYVEKTNVEIVQNEGKTVQPVKVHLCTPSESLNEGAVSQCMNATAIKENSEHCANLTNGELSTEEIDSNSKVEGCTNIEDVNLQESCVQKVSITSELGVLDNVDMKDLEHNASVQS